MNNPYRGPDPHGPYRPPPNVSPEVDPEAVYGPPYAGFQPVQGTNGFMPTSPGVPFPPHIAPHSPGQRMQGAPITRRRTRSYREPQQFVEVHPTAEYAQATYTDTAATAAAAAAANYRGQSYSPSHSGSRSGNKRNFEAEFSGARGGDYYGQEGDRRAQNPDPGPSPATMGYGEVNHHHHHHQSTPPSPHSPGRQPIHPYPPPPPRPPRSPPPTTNIIGAARPRGNSRQRHFDPQKQMRRKFKIGPGFEHLPLDPDLGMEMAWESESGGGRGGGAVGGVRGGGRVGIRGARGKRGVEFWEETQSPHHLPRLDDGSGNEELRLPPLPPSRRRRPPRRRRREDDMDIDVAVDPDVDMDADADGEADGDGEAEADGDGRGPGGREEARRRA